MQYGKTLSNEQAMDRRTFLKTAAVGFAAVQMGGLGFLRSAEAAGFDLPPLPYPQNALEPVISERTVSFHYGKHTAGYYKKAARFTQGTAYASMDMQKIIIDSAMKPAERDVFNNTTQAWNHTFYWAGMSPNGGGAPKGRTLDAMNTSFGSYKRFREQFAEAAGWVFGSGWAWLVKDGPKLRIVTTSNAGNPITDHLKPLLCLDVWEHAYYLDYQNRRGDYIQGFLDRLVNWEFVEKNLG